VADPETGNRGGGRVEGGIWGGNFLKFDAKVTHFGAKLLYVF